MLHLAVIVAVLYVIGRWRGWFIEPQVQQVAVNQAPNEPWITHEKEQEIIGWIKQGGLKNNKETK